MSSISVIVILVLLSYKHYNNESIVFCDSYIDARVKGDEGQSLEANIKMTFKLSKSGDSYAYQRGSVSDMKNIFKVNRFISLKVSNLNSHGFYTTHRIGITKNATDDLPEVYSKILMSPQNTFYYRVDNIGGDMWSLQDLRRTLFICKGR